MTRTTVKRGHVTTEAEHMAISILSRVWEYDSPGMDCIWFITKPVWASLMNSGMGVEIERDNGIHNIAHGVRPGRDRYLCGYQVYLSQNAMRSRPMRFLKDA